MKNMTVIPPKPQKGNAAAKEEVKRLRVAASGSYQEGTGKPGSYGMWNHPRGHVWNVFV